MEIKLTQTVQKGGCAAKVPALELRKILKQVVFPSNDSKVLVDGAHFDDAAVYQVSDELAMVQTLDFFTPIVDTPLAFGKVAAANALSDIYAMGGTPKTAMAIFAFPMAGLDPQIAVQILQGASDIISQAKVNFVGGHSIDDDTIKFGLSVTGYVHPHRIWSNAKAEDGDILILTKALGTGTISAALKRGEISESQMQEAIDSMTKINNVPQLLSATLLEKIHAATDITGFGLLGHSYQMALASQVGLQFEMKMIPYFSLAPELLEKGFLTKAHKSNSQYTEDQVSWANVGSIQKLLLADPQTSGGLLLSVDPGAADEVLAQLRQHFPCSAKIGRVQKNQDKILKFV